MFNYNSVCSVCGGVASGKYAFFNDDVYMTFLVSRLQIFHPVLFFTFVPNTYSTTVNIYYPKPFPIFRLGGDKCYYLSHLCYFQCIIQRSVYSCYFESYFLLKNFPSPESVAVAFAAFATPYSYALNQCVDSSGVKMYFDV